MLFDDEVRRGATLLDHLEPTWRDDVDPFRLDVQLIDRCVLGQVYGLDYDDREAYHRVLYSLGAPRDDRFLRRRTRWEANHGFNVASRAVDHLVLAERAYELLNAAWRRELTRTVDEVTT